MRSVLRGGSMAVGVAIIGMLVAAAPAHAAGVVHVVAPGDSIQAAVDSADPGDTIQLQNGVYAGGVVITKPITIHGTGFDSIIEPGAVNGCASATGKEDGICVTGVPGTPVTGVTISSLTVQNFGGSGVTGVATDQLKVAGIVARNNLEFGIAESASTRGYFTGNRVTGNKGQAGIYVGDVSDAMGTLVSSNRVSRNAVGVLVRHAHNVVITDDMLVRNCTGVALIDDGQMGGQGHTRVSNDLISFNSNFCPPNDNLPTLQGTGVVVVGGQYDTVTYNLVVHNQASQVYSGGIVLVPGVSGRPAANNVISSNLIRQNLPADIVDHSNSDTNTFTNNSCETSQPIGLC